MLNDIKSRVKGIAYYIYSQTLRRLYLSGRKTWPTKSYEVWLFMQFLLFKSQSKSVLELGSGRSTHYFAEYCQKTGGELFSIEQNRAYLRKNIKGLRNNYLKPEGLYYVPIRGDWFDVNILKKIISDTTVSFILIDAPGGGGGGSRNSDVGNKFLQKVSQDAVVIVIDDFHRTEVRSSLAAFFVDRKLEFQPFLLTYPVFGFQNEILFLVRSEISASCVEAIDLFGIKGVLKDFSYSSIANL